MLQPHRNNGSACSSPRKCTWQHTRYLPAAHAAATAASLWYSSAVDDTSVTQKASRQISLTMLSCVHSSSRPSLQFPPDEKQKVRPVAGHEIVQAQQVRAAKLTCQGADDSGRLYIADLRREVLRPSDHCGAVRVHVQRRQSCNHGKSSHATSASSPRQGCPPVLTCSKE